MLTLPFLMTEFNKSKWTITFKRSFAETYNALSKMALDEDCANSLTCTRVFSGGQVASTKMFGDAFSSQLALSSNCGVSQNDDCFSHKIKVGISGAPKEQTVRETLLDKFNFANDLRFYTFRTTRGVSYALFSFGLNCLNIPGEYNELYWRAYVYGYDDNKDELNNAKNQMLSLCGFIVIDVNADQRPNTWGRDVFGMWVTDRSLVGLYPFGGEYDRAFRNKCNTTTGDSIQDTRGCAAQLIKDGWKMTY